MKIERDIIDSILDKISMEDVVSQYVSLKYKGNKYWGCCPFHNEKTPSFSITPEKNLYYCFGCHKGGNIIQFIQEMENLNFPEAIEFLAAKAGVKIPKEAMTKEQTEEERLKEKYYLLYDKVANLFNYFLMEKKMSSDALKYLKSRNISEEIISKFNLGFAPIKGDWLYKFLLSKNYTAEFLEKSGLFSKKYKHLSLFYNRIVFPVRDRQGRTIAFSGRSLSDSGPKYLNSPETLIFLKKKNMFGLYEGISEIRKQKEMFLVEGNFDVLALHSAGKINCAAPLGTAFTEDQAAIISRYVKKVKIFFDPDQAGKKAAEKAVYLLQKNRIETEIVQNELKTDPAEIIEKSGIEALKNSLNYSINSFEYLLKTSLANMDISDYTQKESIAKSLFQYISGFDSEIRREGALSRIADELALTKETVTAEYVKFINSRKSNFSAKTVSADKEEKKEVKNSSELRLMLATLAKPEYFKEIRSKISLNDMYDKEAKDIFIALEDSFREENLAIDYVLSRIENDFLKKLILKKISTEEFNNNTDNIIKESLLSLKEDALKRKKIKLLADIQKFERDNDFQAVRELLDEVRYLDEQINSLRV
jgi:DNA primase